MTTKVAGATASNRAGNTSQTEAMDKFLFDDLLHDEKEDTSKSCLTRLGKIFHFHQESSVTDLKY